ncbi:MAG: hypothetical protein DSZ24_05340 [Thermodesulfatator sp.]|nr:MAG: hypothetical protein DSZ24_05340 [Thermodesulfatator sp.]
MPWWRWCWGPYFAPPEEGEEAQEKRTRSFRPWGPPWGPGPWGFWGPPGPEEERAMLNDWLRFLRYQRRALDQQIEALEKRLRELEEA